MVATRVISPIVRGNKVTFQLESPKATMVNVLGTFNHWSLPDGAMARDASGVWRKTVDVPLKGSYDYKFIVDGEWILDPLNFDYGKDHRGRYNSRFMVDTSASAVDLIRNFSAGLDSHPPGCGRKERRNVLLEADRILQLPTAAHSRILKEHLDVRLQALASAVSRKELSFIGNCYCHGNVLQADGKTLGVDLVTTRTVWGMYWDIPAATVEALANGVDILCISHLHPDHFDPLLIKYLVARGVPVFVPEETEGRFPDGVRYVKANDTISMSGWRITFHRGQHVYDERNVFILRYFEIVTPSGKRIMHTTDHDYSAGLRTDGPVELLIAKAGGVSPLVADDIAFANLLNHVNPRRFLLGHLNELGHPVAGGREPYRTAIQMIERHPNVPGECLHWGETWN